MNINEQTTITVTTKQKQIITKKNNHKQRKHRQTSKNSDKQRQTNNTTKTKNKTMNNTTKKEIKQIKRNKNEWYGQLLLNQTSTTRVPRAIHAQTTRTIKVAMWGRASRKKNIKNQERRPIKYTRTHTHKNKQMHKQTNNKKYI